MNLWERYGFRVNPYETSPVRGDEEGEKLLVGRQKELRKLELLLASSNAHPTIEGQNGVGKTSLVSVAGFRMRKAYDEKKTNQLILPLTRVFQLRSGISAREFGREVFLEVAQNIVANHQFLEGLDRLIPSVSDIESWLASPVSTNSTTNATLAGFGGGHSKSKSPNTSSGFTEAGFAAIVRRWLEDIFPNRNAGGFLCVVDNLELLETSKNARALLEELRDEIFNLPGLIWVLCGARGIILSVASSSRLQGLIADPIKLHPIADQDVPDVIGRRAEVFGTPGESYLPVEPKGFHHLYYVANRNLRTALKFCQDFAMWASEEDEEPESGADKLALLESWMATKADEYEHDTRGVGRRAWSVFDRIGERGGTASPSDYEDFDFQSPQAMRPQIKSLEDAQLVDSAIDEADSRRRTITISARGWIVRYKRSGYALPPTLRK